MRTPMKVDREFLTACIKLADDAKPKTRSELYANVAVAYNAGKAADLKPISSAVVMLRIEEWKLILVTPIGKRGRPLGWKADPNKPRISTNGDKHTVSEYRKAINDFCDSCVGGDKDSIRDCTAKDCQLFPFRPYQPSAVIETTPPVEPQAATVSPESTAAVAEVVAPAAIETATTEEPEVGPDHGGDSTGEGARTQSAMETTTTETVAEVADAETAAEEGEWHSRQEREPNLI